MRSRFTFPAVVCLCAEHGFDFKENGNQKHPSGTVVVTVAEACFYITNNLSSSIRAQVRHITAEK
jgi:hypothetical protein